MSTMIAMSLNFSKNNISVAHSILFKQTMKHIFIYKHHTAKKKKLAREETRNWVGGRGRT